jgi:hypothetical protein
MSVTRFSNGIALGGASIAGESDNKLYVYNSSGTLVGTIDLTQQSALTAQLTTITHTEPTTPDYAIQDLTATSPYGFASKDEGNTVLKVIKNLQIRFSDLETKLRSIGILA